MWCGEWRKLHNEELSDLYSLPNMTHVLEIHKFEQSSNVNQRHLINGRKFNLHFLLILLFYLISKMKLRFKKNL